MEMLPEAVAGRPGTYVLVLELEGDTALPVGRLGRIAFSAGFYTYIGSAFGPGGLRARIGRHGQRFKKCRWHVDYLRRFAEIREIWYTGHPEKTECRWAQTLRQTRGVRVVSPGFGSSDCRCESHLFHFKRKPGIQTFRRKISVPVHIKSFRSSPRS